MAVPKKKLSTQKRGMKRSGERITEISGTRCKECGRVVLQHFECAKCFKRK